jgi:anti-sigma factor RsiW
MIDHAQALLLIPEWLQGAISEREQAELRQHADRCADCQASIEAYRLLQAAINDAAQHPSDETIVRFALDRTELLADERQMVEAHLSSCAGCRAACEAIADAEREALQGNVVAFPRASRATAPSRVAARPTAARQWVAASLLLVVGVAAGKWWFGSRPNNASSWSGIAAMPMIGDTLRDGSGVLTLSVRTGQAFIPVALVASVPAELPADARLRIVIETASGGPLWSTQLTVAEFRQLSQASGALALLVPSADIPAGTEHRLRMISLGDQRDLLVVPMRIVPEESR